MAASPRTAPLNTPWGMLGRRARGRGGGECACALPPPPASVRLSIPGRGEKGGKRLRGACADQPFPTPPGLGGKRRRGPAETTPLLPGGNPSVPFHRVGNGHTDPPPHQRVSHPPTPRVSSDPAEGGLHLPREDGVRLRRFWERTASLRNAPFRRCPGWASRRFFGEKPAQIYCWAFFSGWLCPPPPRGGPGGRGEGLARGGACKCRSPRCDLWAGLCK